MLQMKLNQFAAFYYYLTQNQLQLLINYFVGYKIKDNSSLFYKMQKQKKINSSTISLKVPSRKLLLSQTQTYEDKCKVPEHIYGAFAFKDRVTNNGFSYYQALSSEDINRLQTQAQSQALEPESKAAHQKLKHLLKTYKFTKQFEIKCIRDRYKPNHNANKDKQAATNYSPSNKYCKNTATRQLQISRQQLFKRSKEEFRKMLACGKIIDKQVLKMGKCKVIPRNRGIKQDSKQWIRKEQTKDSICSEEDSKFYERSLNHMNCQLNIDNQFLLNLTQTVKMNTLLKQQLHQNKNRHRLHEEIPSVQTKEQIKKKIQQLSFKPISLQAINFPYPSQACTSDSQDQSNFLEMVGLGFVNEAYLQVLGNPLVIKCTDTKGNNGFHIAAKEGNAQMIRALLKALPCKLGLQMLCSRNKMGRTPLQKAKMLGQVEAFECIQRFFKSPCF